MKLGYNKVTGANRNNILKAIKQLGTFQEEKNNQEKPYGDGSAAHHIIKQIAYLNLE